ncbi:hypothetical protein V5O48_011553 [Marasmius crinis-equi]|uniref:Uncharacterized protein n=1 Tax=Marasmius crinis-equi TaxID=585013 RepID=A0ABR3F5M1_9AGAR
MPPKRKSANQGDAATAKKAKTTAAAKSTAPKLKKSKTVEWNSKWSKEKPEGEWARKSIERWGLLAPYDTSIKDAQWKVYYEERSALDDVNTRNSDASKPIVSEELGQNTFVLLIRASNNVSQAICGAVAEESQRVAIARTLRGSLYYTDLWGNDEEGGGENPRTVNSKTRLYSPFGLGTSVDLVWDYHYRTRMFTKSEKFADLIAMSRSIFECNAEKPLESGAVYKDRDGRQKPREGAVKVIKMNGASMSGTTAKNLEEFEDTLFGGSGWISPLKTFHIIAYAGTVGNYSEALGGQLLKKGGLDKFKFFQDETDGKELASKDLEKVRELYQEVKSKDKKDVLTCVPQRLLALASDVQSAAKSEDTDNAVVDEEKPEEGTEAEPEKDDEGQPEEGDVEKSMTVDEDSKPGTEEEANSEKEG